MLPIRFSFVGTPSMLLSEANFPVLPEPTELYRQWLCNFDFDKGLYQLFGLLLILRADTSRRYAFSPFNVHLPA